jgi:hypothetical protein
MCGFIFQALYTQMGLLGTLRLMILFLRGAAIPTTGPFLKTMHPLVLILHASPGSTILM